MSGERRRAPVAAGEIRAALEARGMTPLHRFGQHFLTEASVLDHIVGLAGIREGDAVLEVGPGTGGLTERLLASGARVVAVEIDRGLARFVEETLGGDPRLEVLARDVMARKSSIAPDVEDAVRRARAGLGRWLVVANLPYNVGSPFLAALFEAEEPPARAVVTVQSEVAEALTARPGTPAYTPISFLMRLYALARRDRRIPPSAFFPRPQVESTVVVIDPRPARRTAPRELMPFVRRLFQQRRKALGGVVARSAEEIVPGGGAAVRDALDAAGIPPGARLEDLEPEVIERLWIALRRGPGEAASPPERHAGP